MSTRKWYSGAKLGLHVLDSDGDIGLLSSPDSTDSDGDTCGKSDISLAGLRFSLREMSGLTNSDVPSIKAATRSLFSFSVWKD